jgi:putative transposase
MLYRAESSDSEENIELWAQTTMSGGQSLHQIARERVTKRGRARRRLVAFGSLARVARSRRNHFAGGIFHISSRGNRAAAIYTDDISRDRFLLLLGFAVERSRWKCLSYCLMTNHFHLALGMEEPTLSAGMHWLNGCYAQWFNKRHGLKGHLFEERFHSEPVETQSHLLEVTRYLPLNPVRARICDHPGEWPWSSYRALAGRTPAGFVATELVLPLFGLRDDKARKAYEAFVDDGRRRVLRERGRGTVPRNQVQGLPS